MAGVKISGLPPVPVAPLLTDIFPEVQPASGGVTYKTTFQQLYNLFSTTAGTINAGLINQLAWYAAAGKTLSGLATANSSVLVTSAGGVPSIGTVLPGGLTTTDPTLTQGLATKNYVDQTALNGTSVYAASAATLGTVTQSGAGVGATLTNAGAQATFALDGVNPPVGVNVLIKNTATGMTTANEGIYTVTSVGSGATNWVLTRATSYDTPTEINATGLILIQNGSTLVGTAWYNAATIVTVDTTAFSYSQFGNIVFPISVANGGTGLNAITAHDLIIGNGSSTVTLLAPSATIGTALVSLGASADPAYTTSAVLTQINTQIKIANGTYTPTAGTKYAVVEVIGSGAGGGASTGVAAQTSGGGGGGSGSYGKKLVTIAQIGASATVVVGAGGAASAGAGTNGGAGNVSSIAFTGSGTITVSANGGLGGTGGSSSATVVSTGLNGAAANAGSGGDINMRGNPGFVGWAGGAAGIGGSGGSSVLGGAGAGGVNSSGAGTGINSGSGGGGAGTSGATFANGSAGADGIVIITEYIYA